MNIEYLHKEPSRRLILIFGGWSTQPCMYSSIGIQGWDVAVVYDYDTLHPINKEIEGYDTIYLFAWSLGVYAADMTLDDERITEAFAINGTLWPVHDTFGIPESIYKGTRNTLSPRNLDKFRRRMMPDSASFKELFGGTTESNETVTRLADQLLTFESENYSETPRLRWTRAYIGRDDRIFPPGNMLRAWKRLPETRIVETSDAHFPNFQSIISGVIADTSKVSRRFGKAFGTYDSYAIAQQMIALHLGRLARKATGMSNLTVNRLLEIGPGTGFLTASWAGFLTPLHTDFVDIADVGPFHIEGSADYYKADAEEWIHECDKCYDIIMSASAIQWFADIPRFLTGCARILKPGGLLAISTFAPGNLGELDALRPAPLLYPSVGQIKMMLEPFFENIVMETSSIRLEFESRRYLLLHLKHTGVAGSASSSSARSDISTLTYKPLYITCSRRYE